MLPGQLFYFFTLPLLASAARPKKDAILLSQVETLTLKGRGAMTSSRRVSPVPQLKCISSRDLCALHQIDVMRCKNQGSSYGDEDIEWSCAASLPRELKLGSTDVICEGYSSSDDPYVLKGSCGVEYRLALTDEGEQKYPDLAKGGWLGGSGSRLGSWLFGLLFFGVLLWILYSIRERANGRDPMRRAGGRRPGDGGGGGGGWHPGWGPDNDDPPPPYYPGPKQQSARAQRGWQPGFWSGLAGGAAAGYFAGGRNNRNSGSQSGRSGSSFGSASSSSSSSLGGARHQSTGFGSTSRR